MEVTVGLPKGDIHLTDRTGVAKGPDNTTTLPQLRC